MSHQSHIGSVTDKQNLDEDKCGLYSSSRTDSGFISSEITSEEFDDLGVIEEKKKVGYIKPVIDSGIIEEEDEDSLQGDPKKPTSMLLDSGVCLSENLSKIYISQGFNDLDAPLKTTLVDSTPSLSGKNESQQRTKDATPDIPWKIYFEQDEDGDTHLHLAILSGYTDLALALIRCAPYPYLLDMRNDDCDSPLHLAVATGQWQVARWLIIAGANPCPRNANGDSPLHLAAKANDYKCVKALADPVKQQEKDHLALNYQGQVYRQCDFDQWNHVGQTCVHVAALYGNIEVLRHLIWYGANVNAKEGCGGYTALHIAVERVDEPLVHFLAQCDKIDLEALNYRGRNALEVTQMVPSQLMQLLRTKGVPSPYVSDSEEDIEDSDEEMIYENTHLFNARMVNAGA